ncbi:MAG: LSU ribosomal protein L19p, partial [uncultured Sphingomonadaceae bacterium]
EPSPDDRGRADRTAPRRQAAPRFPAGRHAPRRRARGRGRPHPRTGVRRRVHRARQPRHGFVVHCAQDQLRRGRGARVPALLAERRKRGGGAPRRGTPGQALLPTRPHRQVGAHRRAARPALGRGQAVVQDRDPGERRRRDARL